MGHPSFFSKCHLSNVRQHTGLVWPAEFVEKLSAHYMIHSGTRTP